MKEAKQPGAPTKRERNAGGGAGGVRTKPGSGCRERRMRLDNDFPVDLNLSLPCVCNWESVHQSD